MAWRLAKSLETLRSEWNATAPNRSKVSDGTLGDPAHASRASRHNPNNFGVVCALDVTHDPANGCDIHAFARRHVASPHPELEYIISNAQVAKRSTGFRWEPYYGTNEHRQHAHFAVGRGPDSEPTPPYDSTAPWHVDAAPTPAPAYVYSGEDDEMHKPAMIVKAVGKPEWWLTDLITKQHIKNTRHVDFLRYLGVAKWDDAKGAPFEWDAVAVDSIRTVA